MENEGQLRFSLRTLLIVLTITSLLIAAMTSFTGAWGTAILYFLIQLIALVFLMGLIWGRKYERAFCLGALLPTAVTLFTVTAAWTTELRYIGFDVEDIVRELDRYNPGFRFVAGSAWICSLLLGLVALALRRWVFRGGA